MQQLETFDVDQALAGAEKVLGELPWVDEGIAIASITVEGDRVAINLKAPCFAAAGDSVLLAGYGFQVDGFYKVAEVAQPSIVVEISDRASKNAKRKIQKRLSVAPHGYLHEQANYDVIGADFLDAAGMLELKKLTFERSRFAKQKEEYSGLESASDSARSKLVALINSLKIEEEAQNSFAESVSLLSGFKAKEDAEMQIGRIKKEYGIKSKTFSKDAWAIAIAYRQMALDSAEESQGYIEKIVGPERNLIKREIELLCGMPAGLMSALDSVSQIDQRISEMYVYVRQCLSNTVDEEESDDTEKKEAA